MPPGRGPPPAEAAVEEAHARLLDAEAAFNRDPPLYQKKMLAASDFDKDRYTMQAAEAALARAEADLAKLKAGAWKEDIDVQRSAVEQARSQVESIKIQLDRLIVRAPVDGEILQVNVRPGQFAALAWKEPMVVLGDVTACTSGSTSTRTTCTGSARACRAWATVKGRKEPRFTLEFVRIEPYVIPKKSLTGDNSERVDTRVLQVLYALPDDGPRQVYVGQQMDVFLRRGQALGRAEEKARRRRRGEEAVRGLTGRPAGEGDLASGGGDREMMGGLVPCLSCFSAFFFSCLAFSSADSEAFTRNFRICVVAGPLPIWSRRMISISYSPAAATSG